MKEIVIRDMYMRTKLSIDTLGILFDRKMHIKIPKAAISSTLIPVINPGKDMILIFGKTK